MTGFGRGVADHAGVRATVDIRSVNHRFVDLKLRAQVSPALEDAITGKVKAAVERGALTVSLHLDKPRVAGVIRMETARAVHAELVALAHELEIAEPDLALVLAQPGVVAPQDASEPDAAVLAALDAALAQLAEMRAREGRALETELAARLDELARLRGAIDVGAARVPEQLQKRLHERVRRLLGDDAVDPQRLAQEVALLAERADVTEELVRLGSHLEQARSLVRGKAAAGRRLEFLVQEIGRELNTIGSKSQDAEITSHVVEAKAILEKLREQVQNVE
ncbi:MAG TPA: YicC/YloC family endoribonuclease [Kofleriaceae bacterium]|jgi:uncharacterized protein (TIGR00255 family)